MSECLRPPARDDDGLPVGVRKAEKTRLTMPIRAFSICAWEGGNLIEAAIRINFWTVRKS